MAKKDKTTKTATQKTTKAAEPASEAKVEAAGAPEPIAEPEVPGEAPVPAATVKPPRARREVPARVFAFRLDDAELEAIHRTAGPRNASRFMRAVAAAFASEDEGAFRKTLKEAAEARAAD